MITDKENARFHEIARQGIEHSDPNFNVHGAALERDLRHYEKLVKPEAMAPVEKRIRFSARQIARGRTPYETKSN
jgi:hypothetical protein